MQRKSGVVVIAGRPNAGKSSLLNRVLGTRLSIVTPKPQTTREGLRGVLTEAQGQIVFIDTPGIHQAREGGINQYMMNQVEQALEDPDLVWYLVDPRSALYHEESVLKMLAAARCPVFLAFTKADLEGDAYRSEARAQFEIELDACAKKHGVNLALHLQISSRTGVGVTELLAATWSTLPTGPLLYPDEDELSDRPARFFAGEIIREQLFVQLGEELPYSCAVQVRNYQEDLEPLRIEAVIYVERDSQKGMVIGKGGLKIKEIGTAARKRLEEFTERKVFLGLRTEVLHGWSRDADRLRQLGYSLPKKRRS